MNDVETGRKIEQAMLKAVDPSNTLNGKPLPALTTLLFKVCDNDHKRFEEACRLTRLFIKEALIS